MQIGKNVIDRATAALPATRDRQGRRKDRAARDPAAAKHPARRSRSRIPKQAHEQQDDDSAQRNLELGEELEQMRRNNADENAAGRTAPERAK